jgi:hypothetical protein
MKSITTFFCYFDESKLVKQQTTKGHYVCAELKKTLSNNSTLSLNFEFKNRYFQYVRPIIRYRLSYKRTAAFHISLT